MYQTWSIIGRLHYVAYQFAYLKMEDVLLPYMQAVKLPPITIWNYLHYYIAVCYYE